MLGQFYNILKKLQVQTIQRRTDANQYQRKYKSIKIMSLPNSTVIFKNGRCFINMSVTVT